LNTKTKGGPELEKAFVSWSGGKDCCQAAYLAIRQGLQVQCLLNMVNPEFERSCSHGISARWINLQSTAMGIPLVQPSTSGDDYEAVFVNTIAGLKKQGVTVGVFGDIDFLPHLEWIQNVCQKAGIKPVLPLWGGDQNKIARNFIDLGFTSIVVATRADMMGEEWLGRTVDHQFLQDIAQLDPRISPCGEAGEFHSLVIDGPLFRQRIEIREAQNVRRLDHWIYDIQRCELKDKEIRS
jgi:diphthine-ammonia ligase